VFSLFAIEKKKTDYNLSTSFETCQ